MIGFIDISVVSNSDLLWGILSSFLFIIGFSGSKQKTGLEVREFPGLFGTNELSQEVANLLGVDRPEGQAGTIGEVLGLGTAGIIGQGLTQREQAPFGPSTQAEQDLLNSLMDITGGRTATRGLGAPTQTALAQTIAPTLVGFRQKEQDRLVQEQQIQQQQQAMQLQSLLELAGLSMPQLIGGTEGSARQFAMSIMAGGGKGGSMGGGGATKT
jgi:hypothetical protein